MKPVPIQFTEAQKKYLEKKKKETGRPIAELVRNLVQERMEKSQ